MDTTKKKYLLPFNGPADLKLALEKICDAFEKRKKLQIAALTEKRIEFHELEFGVSVKFDDGVFELLKIGNEIRDKTYEELGIDFNHECYEIKYADELSELSSKFANKTISEEEYAKTLNELC